MSIYRTANSRLLTPQHTTTAKIRTPFPDYNRTGHYTHGMIYNMEWYIISRLLMPSASHVYTQTYLGFFDPFGVACAAETLYFTTELHRGITQSSF